MRKQHLIKMLLTFILSFVFLVCEKNPTESKVKVPEVVTYEVTDITGTSAKCGGNITSDGGATVTMRGVCWSIGQTPKVSDNKTNDSTGAGSFFSNITGLIPSTTYYVRAYATNSAGTGYGSAMSFTTWQALQTGTMTDYDGNTYQTVKIGDQWWMAENLKVTHYRNGDAIPNITGNSGWYDLTTGAYCDYDNNSSNVSTYGRLYNWYAVDDSRNIAPTGWHVPSDEEWKQLEMYLGMSQSEADGTGYRGTDEGSKLKSTSGWINNGNGTNESGFTALSGGSRDHGGTFANMGSSADFWSLAEYHSTNAWSRSLGYYYSDVYRYYRSKHYGFSVRLIRD